MKTEAEKKQALLESWRSIQMASINYEGELVTYLSQHLETVLAYEVVKNLPQTDIHTAQVLDGYGEQLREKVHTTVPARARQFNTIVYSPLGAEILEQLAEELYVQLIKLADLCLAKLGGSGDAYVTFPAFKAGLAEVFATLNLPLSEAAYDQQKVIFEQTFETVLKAWLRDRNPWQDPRLLTDSVNGLERMCQILIETFEGIVAYEKQVKSSLEDNPEAYQIIGAISDTLVIKIDNIRDNMAYFLSEVEAEIQSVDETSFVGGGLALWYETQVQVTQLAGVEGFFAALEGTPIHNKAMKQAENLVKKVAKLEFNYKKEQLLFEITTFKELLNYSIERLKQSTDMNILMYIQVVEEANSMINTTLASVEIKTIDPPAKTSFTAKEHEVLMTQVEAGYQKGEIIKVANPGYHQNGQVLIRASVVVAR